MVEKYIAWEYVKDAPYILVPRSFAFENRTEPLVRLGKHYRDQLTDFDRLVEIVNMRDCCGNFTSIVHYLARYIPSR